MEWIAWRQPWKRLEYIKFERIYRKIEFKSFRENSIVRIENYIAKFIVDENTIFWRRRIKTIGCLVSGWVNWRNIRWKSKFSFASRIAEVSKSRTHFLKWLLK